MAKKLVQYEQLKKLTQGLYGKLHQELAEHDVKIDAHTTAITKALVQVNEDISKKANQTDLTALTGRVTTAEGAIDTINGSETTEGSIAKALKDAKGYADTQDGELHKTITGEINAAKTALQSNIDAKADAAAMETQLNAKADAADLTAEIDRAKAAEKANADAIAIINGEANVDGSIKKALADAKADAASKYATTGALNGVSERVGTAESKITDLENAVGKDDQGKLISVASQIQAVNTAAGELAGRVTQAEKDIDAIEKDYLKASDKTALEGKIAEAKEQADKGVADAATAKGVADDAKGKIDTFLKDATINGAVVDTLKEIQEYVTSDGAAADQMVKDIASKVAQTDYDAKVQELEDADTALGERAGALETLVGKKAQGDQEATGLVKEVADNKAGIATNKTEITNLKKAMGDVTQVAAQSALDAVKGRVKTVEDKVSGLETAVGAPAAEGKVATGLYKAVADEAARATAAEDALDGRVDTLEATVGNAASGLVKDVDDLQTAVANLNGSSHTHANKEELDKFVTGDKAKLDDAVAKVTGNADTDGTIANAKKAGTDAQAAVNGLKLGVDLSDDTKAVVQLKTSADAVQNSIEIVYPYEFVSDQEIQTLIDGLGTQA